MGVDSRSAHFDEVFIAAVPQSLVHLLSDQTEVAQFVTAALAARHNVINAHVRWGELDFAKSTPSALGY